MALGFPALEACVHLRDAVLPGLRGRAGASPWVERFRSLAQSVGLRVE